MAAYRGQEAVVQYLCQLPPERGMDVTAAGPSLHGQYMLYRVIQGHTALALVMQVHSPAPDTTRLGVVRPLAYAMVEQATQLEPHPVSGWLWQAAGYSRLWDVMRFAVLELPGGSRWAPLVDASSHAEGSAAAQALLAVVRRQRMWQTRGCLFMLRLLRQAHRAVPYASA